MIGYINVVSPTVTEYRVQNIERGDGELSDRQRKDQALRIQEIKHQREISRGARIRLYNAKGRLEIESE